MTVHKFYARKLFQIIFSLKSCLYKAARTNFQFRAQSKIRFGIKQEMRKLMDT